MFSLVASSAMSSLDVRYSLATSVKGAKELGDAYIPFYPAALLVVDPALTVRDAC